MQVKNFNAFVLKHKELTVSTTKLLRLFNEAPDKLSCHG